MESTALVQGGARGWPCFAGAGHWPKSHQALALSVELVGPSARGERGPHGPWSSLLARRRRGCAQSQQMVTKKSKKKLVDLQLF